MPPEDYQQFLLQFPLLHYTKGEVFISPDTLIECTYYIEQGTVRKYDITKFGEKVVMNVFNTPSLIPLSWALNKTPNRYYFEALEDLTLRCIPADILSAYLKEHPTIAYHLLQQVFLGLENTQRRVAYLMRGSLRSRVLFELLIEARRSGDAQADGSYVINVNETELAERAGLSRETISRELAKVFKTSDLCQRHGRAITIRSLEELEAVLQKIT
jgi:CRP-like cAMP-binding protein